MPTSGNNWENSAHQTDIYPIPVNSACTGTVTAIEFCYRIHQSRKSEYLQVLTLSTLNQTGTSFQVKKSIAVYVNVSTSTCDGTGFVYCCSTASLNITDYFSLPTNNFAIGVKVTDQYTPTLQMFQSSHEVDGFIYQGSLEVGGTLNSLISGRYQFQALRLHLSKSTSTYAMTIMN